MPAPQPEHDLHPRYLVHVGTAAAAALTAALALATAAIAVAPDGAFTGLATGGAQRWAASAFAASARAALTPSASISAAIAATPNETTSPAG